MSIRMPTVGIVALLAAWPVQAADPDVLHIGIVDSLLQEASPSERKLFGKEFKDLVQDFSGLKSVVLEGLSPASAAKQLDKEKWHLGVFHGVEFAWVQAKHPQLRPLMVAATRVSPVRAVLLANKESAVTGFADLKGKNVSVLQNLHCQLYTEKGTGNERNYFAKTAQTRNVEEALDALFRGELQGAIVDSPSLALYKELQPGRFDRLKTVAESDPFPPAVIVYHDRTLSNNLLKLLKQRMLKVKDSDKGKEALAAFRISGFESVPADYQKTLTSILQAYPAKEGD